MWVELDMHEPPVLRQISDSTSVPICSAETLIGMREYRLYLEAGAMDVCMVDLSWNG